MSIFAVIFVGEDNPFEREEGEISEQEEKEEGEISDDEPAISPRQRQKEADLRAKITRKKITHGA